MNEQANPTPDQHINYETALGYVIDGIKSGVLDDRLKEIQNIIRLRQELRKDEILELVHEVFGSDATITIEKEAVLSNPFEKKIQGQNGGKSAIISQPEEESDVIESQSEDVLAHLDEVERQMDEETSSDEEPEVVAPEPVEVPIEQRGATISGLHSSQIE